MPGCNDVTMHLIHACKYMEGIRVFTEMFLKREAFDVVSNVEIKLCYKTALSDVFSSCNRLRKRVLCTPC